MSIERVSDMASIISSPQRSTAPRVGRDLIFTSASIFQALGNTWPSLGSSAIRLVIFAAPAAALSMRPGFTIREVWYLSVATVAVQAVTNLALLQREFRRKLTFAAAPLAQTSAAGEMADLPEIS